MLHLETTKQNLIADIKARQNDNIIDTDKAELLIELIQATDTEYKAQAIAMLGTTYKRTGFHFEKRFAKMTNSIKYFKKSESLSFKNNTPPPLSNSLSLINS